MNLKVNDTNMQPIKKDIIGNSKKVQDLPIFFWNFCKFSCLIIFYYSINLAIYVVKNFRCRYKEVKIAADF